MNILYGMIVCFILFLFCNSMQLSMDDNSEKTSGQFFLIILALLFGFLSLPLTAVYFFGAYSQISRMDRKHQRELLEVSLESEKKHLSKIRELEQQLLNTDTQVQTIRKSSYDAGYRVGIKDSGIYYEKQIEYARSTGYRDGYVDGQNDHQHGINLLNETTYTRSIPEESDNSLIQDNNTSTPSDNTSTPSDNTSRQADMESQMHCVTAFNGESLRIPGSSMDEFRRRNKENEEAYFKQYGHLRSQLFDYLRERSTDYLNAYASVHNRESFMYLTTAILSSTCCLSGHYATVSKIYSDILCKTLETPADIVCIYRSEKALRDAQWKWINTLKVTYKLNYQSKNHKDLLTDEKKLKKFAKEIFQMAAPRARFSLKSQKALILLLHEFDQYAQKAVSAYTTDSH